MSGFLSKKIDVIGLLKKPFTMAAASVKDASDKLKEGKEEKEREQKAAHEAFRDKVLNRPKSRGARAKHNKRRQTIRTRSRDGSVNIQASGNLDFDEIPNLEEVFNNVSSRVNDIFGKEDAKQDPTGYGAIYNAVTDEKVSARRSKTFIYRFRVAPDKVILETKVGNIWKKIDFFPGGPSAYKFCYKYFTNHLTAQCLKNDSNGFPTIKATVDKLVFIEQDGSNYIADEPQNVTALAGIKATISW